jgi:hypothetical protein
MMKRNRNPLLFIFVLLAMGSGARAEDAWDGLSEPEEKTMSASLVSDDEVPDLSPMQEAPALSPKEAENTSLADPTKVSKEDEILTEYEAYVKRKETESSEDKLRQRVFHEGARNNIAFDVTIDDFNKYNWGPNSGLPNSTYGINFGYNAVPWRSKHFGRFALGLNAGIIGLSKSGGHFRTAFFQAGPRASYELKFMTAQVLVPTAFIGYDRLFNQIKGRNLIAGADQSFNTLIFGGGLLINLNRLDSATATKSLVATGIRKFNLALLFQSRKGDTASRSSSFFSAGFRFEY